MSPPHSFRRGTNVAQKDVELGNEKCHFSSSPGLSQMRAGYGQHEELKIWVVPRFVQSTWRKNDEKLMRGVWEPKAILQG